MEFLSSPPEKMITGSKWTFKAKYNPKGVNKKCKVRFILKVFSQKFVCDYEETFAPVITLTTIRSFLMMAAHKNLEVNHGNIKTVFLHGDLGKEACIIQPKDYVNSCKENKVCKINKTICSLKQVASVW